MTFEIQQGIPVPTRRGRSMPYPFEEMRPNTDDSFLIPAETPEKVKSLRASVYNVAKRRGYKITASADTGGLRVWRVA